MNRFTDYITLAFIIISCNLIFQSLVRLKYNNKFTRWLSGNQSSSVRSYLDLKLVINNIIDYRFPRHQRRTPIVSRENLPISY